jgi:leader peptidase (prepilin peptidase) / N-methyltransferase
MRLRTRDARVFGVVEVVIASLVGAAVGVFLVGVVEHAPYGRPLLSRAHTRGEGTVGAGVRRRGLPRAALFPVVTAVVFGALAARFGLSAELPAFLYLGAIGVALAAIDLAHHRLPNTLVLPSYPVGLVLLGAAAATRGDGDAYLRALAGMAVLYGAYFLLLLAHPAGLGFGDVKLAGLLGLHLAWLGWGVLMVGAALGVFAGGLAGVLLLVARRVNRRSSIAYGPALLAGAFVAILWGQQIADWYVRSN